MGTEDTLPGALVCMTMCPHTAGAELAMAQDREQGRSSKSYSTVCQDLFWQLLAPSLCVPHMASLTQPAHPKLE